MLSNDEEEQVREAVSAVANRGASAISKAASAWEAIGFIRSLHSSIDKAIATEGRNNPEPACKPGCSFCCSAKVEITDPEALHIARHLARLSPDTIEQLEKALAQQSLLRANSEISARIPCAFLQEGLCSIYDARPATCRKAHSLSLQACENNASQLPQNLTVLLHCDAIIAGTTLAFQKCGLPSERMELGSAVLAALSRSTSADNWFDGKPLISSSEILTRIDSGSGA